jgi:hypothetical protein
MATRREAPEAVHAEFTHRFARHAMKEAVSRSFDFRTPGTSAYAFRLTWTAGTLSLAGDLGDMVLNQWHAMPTFAEAISWASSADWHYLLSKSGVREVYDADLTAADVVAMADDDAHPTIDGHRREMLIWYREKPKAAAFARYADYLEELEGWSGDRPTLEFSQHGMSDYDHLVPGGLPRITPPDGFELWDRLRDEFTPWADRASVLYASGRAEISQRVAAFYRDASPDRAAEKSNDLELSDFYYSTSWSHSDLAKIAAIQFGVAQIAAMLAGEPRELAA